jgi:hypothetical protein
MIWLPLTFRGGRAGALPELVSAGSSLAVSVTTAITTSAFVRAFAEYTFVDVFAINIKLIKRV